MHFMHFKKRLNIGNISFDFICPLSLRSKLKNAIGLFKAAGCAVKKNKINIKFMEIEERDMSISETPKSVLSVFKSCTKMHNFSSFDKRGLKILKDTFCLYGRTPFLLEIIRQNLDRFHLDFIIFVVNNGGLLIVVDTKMRVGWVFYLKFKTWKGGVSSLAFCVRFLINVLVPISNSFVLHSSSIKIDGKGYLFIGVGGAGKTTISKIILRNLKNTKIVADDNVLISLEENSVYAYKICYLDKRIGIGRVINKMKVNDVFFIKKSQNPLISQKDRYEALKEIISFHLQNKVWVTGNRKNISKNVLKFINMTKPKILEFRKDSSFLELLRT